MKNTYKSLFMLDSKITFLNHGSFGACPRPIFESLINWQHKLELDPVKHLAFDIYDYLENSRNYRDKYVEYIYTLNKLFLESGAFFNNSEIFKLLAIISSLPEIF